MINEKKGEFRHMNKSLTNRISVQRTITTEITTVPKIIGVGVIILVLFAKISFFFRYL